MIINLDKSFKPFGEGIDFESFNFPSGCEPHIKFGDLDHEPTLITCRIRSMNDMVLLLLATDALKRSGVKTISAFIPYLPFARQDRMMVKGEPLSVKVMADILNLQGYESVGIYDPHSDVSMALIDNSRYFDNHSLAAKVLADASNFVVASPDAGAYKKIFKLCQAVGYKDDIVLCNKVRNVETGQIVDISVDVDDLGGKDVYIIDDICDGGGTFVLLAQELRKRNCGRINVVVSHGIFSKGTTLAGIDHIYCSNSFSDISNSENFTQISLNQLIVW